MSGATSHWWCPILGRARLEGPLSQLFPWKMEPRPIFSKLTGDLPHGRDCLPWRQQVPTTIPWWAVQMQVNVPNYIWSCRLCTTLVNLGELGCSTPWLKFPWKLNLGQSAWNSQGTYPWPRTTFPIDGKSQHYPLQSRPFMSKCAKSQSEPLAIDEAPSSAGLGWKAP